MDAITTLQLQDGLGHNGLWIDWEFGSGFGWLWRVRHSLTQTRSSSTGCTALFLLNGMSIRPI
ncbi:hypothetical protein H9L39_18068 [Fusarium oxysporum f. sp. albedinis]|nr:hypothetical protein H9L39_18068 [Fusarium oxysporum f. sp. albedinis]